MLTSSKKAKGRKLQQWVCSQLYRYLGGALEDYRSTSMGAPGADVLMSAEAKRRFPYTIECKAQEGYKKLYDAYAQARANNKGELTPLVVIRANHEIALAVLPLEALLQLYANISKS